MGRVLLIGNFTYCMRDGHHALSLSRAVLCADPSGDEQRGCLIFDIGGVPTSRRVDDILSRADGYGSGGAVGMFLMQCHLTFGAQHHFVARRMHFPAVPAIGECVHRNQPSFGSVGTMALRIVFVPRHSSERRLRKRLGAEPQMDRMREQIFWHGSLLPFLQKRRISAEGDSLTQLLHRPKVTLRSHLNSRSTHHKRVQFIAIGVAEITSIKTVTARARCAFAGAAIGKRNVIEPLDLLL